MTYFHHFFWTIDGVLTFNSPEARRSKVDTRSWGTPASSSSLTQMWEVSSVRQDLRKYLDIISVDPGLDATQRQCPALRSSFWPAWTPQARLQWVQDHSSFQPPTSSSNTWRRKGLKKLCQSHLVVSMSIFFASSNLLKARILSKESFLRLMSMAT